MTDDEIRYHEIVGDFELFYESLCKRHKINEIDYSEDRSSLKELLKFVYCQGWITGGNFIEKEIVKALNEQCKDNDTKK